MKGKKGEWDIFTTLFYIWFIWSVLGWMGVIGEDTNENIIDISGQVVDDIDDYFSEEQPVEKSKQKEQECIFKNNIYSCA